MPVNHTAARLHRLREHIADLLLPPRCLACGEPALHIDLCAACQAALPCNTIACPQCALPLAAPAPACGECLAKPPPFALGIAPWRYEGCIAQLLPRLKFQRELAVARSLGSLALQQLRDWPGWQQADCLIPMPLHSKRLGQRGYNQALELARPLAQGLNLRIDTHSLSRIRATAPQTDLDAPARRRNLRGAFHAKPLNGARVILLDDVITTATTVREAAKTLLKAGAAHVNVVAMARVP